MRFRRLALLSALAAACNNPTGSPPPAPDPADERPSGDSSDRYDPCAGKACGDRCTLCAPDDPDCMETAEVKACNPEGNCVTLSEKLCPAK